MFSTSHGEPVAFQNHISLVQISVPVLMKHGHLLTASTTNTENIVSEGPGC